MRSEGKGEKKDKARKKNAKTTPIEKHCKTEKKKYRLPVEKHSKKLKV